MLKKTLDAAHDKLNGRLLGINWNDKESNVDVRKRMGLTKLEQMIKEKNASTCHLSISILN